MAFVMGMASKIGLMAADMMANGRMEKQTDKACCTTRMVTSMKVIGLMTRLTVQARTLMQMERSMWELGVTISSTVMD